MRFPPTTDAAACLLRASGFYSRLAARSGSIAAFDEQSQIRGIRFVPNPWHLQLAAVRAVPVLVPWRATRSTKCAPEPRKPRRLDEGRRDLLMHYEQAGNSIQLLRAGR
jgi:hypothetical protein